MTAIYGFASKQDNTAFIAADNLEYNSKKRVDKIHYLENRFAIGITGQDIVASVLASMVSFETCSNFKKSISIEKLVADILKYTGILSQCVYPKYEKEVRNGRLPKAHLEIAKRNSITLIILDCLNYELFEAFLGSAFPPDNLRKHADIKKLFDNKLHLFSLAAKDGRASQEDLDIKAIPDIQNFLLNRVNKDKSRKPIIGDLGATVISKNNKAEYFSCFSTISELIKESFDFVPGFTINMLNLAEF